MIYRNAEPNEFVLKRDDRGYETIEHKGVVFAEGAGGPWPSAVRRLYADVGISDERLSRVVEAANVAGFWRPGGSPRPERGGSPFSVKVSVP